MALHPFQKLFSGQGSKRKPHCFRVDGIWRKVGVPTEHHYPDRHSLSGQWIEKMNSAAGHGGARRTVEAGSPVAHKAIARHVARRHG